MHNTTASPVNLLCLGATCLLAVLPLSQAIAAEGDAAPKPAATRRLDMAELQPLVSGGKAAEALQQLEAALEKDPDNARLLYNHGIAAYAAGRLEDALVSFDRAETAGRGKIATLAKFQKGNAEFRLGDSARRNNLDETIARWKQSLDNYKDALKDTPDDPRSMENYKFVRGRLLNLLIEDAR